MTVWDFVDKHPWWSMIALIVVSMVIYDSVVHVCNVFIARKKG